jgi:hypothetical protein
MSNECCCPPDVSRQHYTDGAFRPSWSGPTGYLNDEHAAIWHTTKDFQGWQLPADSEKLYEMANYCGSVILEIGMFAGRSAVVELRGALNAHHHNGKPRPQFYGVDIDPCAVSRTYQTLHQTDLSEYAVLFAGNLTSFHRAYPITPSMVFVDGDHDFAGVWADLQALRSFLAAGTPVMCHDYTNPLYPGVKQAVDQWVGSGEYDALGIFGCSALLRTTSCCTGHVQGLNVDAFERAHRAQLFKHMDYLERARTELEVRTKEFSSSRWRKLGLALGIAKRTSWERASPQPSN